MEDWNAVDIQRVIDDYFDKHRIYCMDCDYCIDGYCIMTHMNKHERDSCKYGTRRIEHIVGRSNDTTGTADNLNNDSRMDNQPVICSYPCMDSNCKHHPIAAPVDGTTCRYIDLFKSEGCVRDD